MANVYKRSSDRKRGRSGKWTIAYIGEDGKRRVRAGYTDKAESLRLAQQLETEAGQVRAGLVDPAERLRRTELAKPIGDQIESYGVALSTQGDTPKHVREIRTVLTRLFAAAEVPTLADLDAVRIQAALAAEPLAARTVNKHRGFVLAFARWLEDHGRIHEVPRGLTRIERRKDESERVRRRSLTRSEVGRLIRAAETGPPFVAFRGPRRGPRQTIPITGPERAAVYHLALGTGFRANEVRTLTPEAFALDGPDPSITVHACYAKNGKTAVQPITVDLAETLRPFVAQAGPGIAVFPIPVKTAQMLRRDLEAARIEPSGVDFHSLRHTFVSHLIAGGANPKVVQSLARHSTITLTMDRYAHADETDLRAALKKVG